MLTHTAESLRSKYYCNSSGKSKISDHGKHKERLSTNKHDTDGQSEIAVWQPKLEVRQIRNYQPRQARLSVAK